MSGETIAEKRDEADRVRPMRIVWGVMIAGMLIVPLLFFALQQRVCGERITTRDDARSVWLYLVAREPERRNDADVVEFVEYLDGRLPPLQCNWLGRPEEVS